MERKKMEEKMKTKRLMLVAFVFLFFSLSFASASYSDCSKYGNCQPAKTTGGTGDNVTNNDYSNTTNYYSLGVNQTQMENATILNIKESWLDTIYQRIIGLPALVVSWVGNWSADKTNYYTKAETDANATIWISINTTANIQELLNSTGIYNQGGITSEEVNGTINIYLGNANSSYLSTTNATYEANITDLLNKLLSVNTTKGLQEVLNSTGLYSQGGMVSSDVNNTINIYLGNSNSSYLSTANSTVNANITNLFNWLKSVNLTGNIQKLIDNSSIARIGDCPAGQLVQNTTIGGVQCVAVSGGGMDYTNVAMTNQSNSFIEMQNITGDVNILNGSKKRLTISKSSDKIGINTESPYSVFDIATNSSLYDDTNSRFIFSSTSPTTKSNPYLDFQSYADVSNQYNGIRLFTNTTTGSTSTDFFIQTTGHLGRGFIGSQVFTTLMSFISKTGNVGIGTINPQSKLEIVGNVSITGTLYAKGVGITNRTMTHLHTGNSSLYNQTVITIAMSANSNYTVKCNIEVASNGTTKGTQLNISYPFNRRYANLVLNHPTTATAVNYVACQNLTSCLDLSTTSVVYPSFLPVDINGLIETQSAGNFEIRMKSETSRGNSSVMRGSFCTLTSVN